VQQLSPLRYISYIAIVIYLGFGLYLLAKPGVLEGYSPNVQTGLGIILLLYGLFRLWIIIQRNRMIKKQNENEQQNEK